MAANHDPDGAYNRSLLAGCVWPILAFLGSLALGLAATILIVRAISPTVPHPTEANEAFANGIEALMRFVFGAIVSFVAAFLIAAVVAARVNKEAEPNREQCESGPGPGT
jgi:Na+/proline symporter